MSNVSIEEFTANPAAFLALAEDGQELVIARAGTPVARLVPGADPFEREREDWIRLSMQNLARCYGPDEPEYDESMLIERNPLFCP